MPYPALPSSRRRHYEIDGSIFGWNQTSYATGMTSVASGAQMLALNEETPSVDSALYSAAGGQNFFYLMFPELVDVTNFICRCGSGGQVFQNIQTSPDSTNGNDGTWNTPSTSGTLNVFGSGGDWWRSTTPASLTTNNTSLKGIRFQIQMASNGTLNNVYVWGTKHSGQTPDDIIFLESDGATEWPNDEDWGDIPAGTGASVHTYYVKNASGTHTANTITLKMSGSDSTRWTISLDNVSFGSSQSISSLVAGAQQIFYVKFTPPTAAAANYRPYAGYIEADVVSWS